MSALLHLLCCSVLLVLLPQPLPFPLLPFTLPQPLPFSLSFSLPLSLVVSAVRSLRSMVLGLWWDVGVLLVPTVVSSSSSPSSSSSSVILLLRRWLVATMVLTSAGRSWRLVKWVGCAASLAFLDLLEVALEGGFTRDLHDGAGLSFIHNILLITTALILILCLMIIHSPVLLVTVNVFLDLDAHLSFRGLVLDERMLKQLLCSGPVLILFNQTCLQKLCNFLDFLDFNLGGGFRGIRKRARIGCMSHKGGFPSAISMTVIPRDHRSLLLS